MTFLHDIIDPLLLSYHFPQLLSPLPQLLESPIFLLLPGLDLQLILEDPRQFLLQESFSKGLHPGFVLIAAEELEHPQLPDFYLHEQVNCGYASPQATPPVISGAYQII